MLALSVIEDNYRGWRLSKHGQIQDPSLSHLTQNTQQITILYLTNFVANHTGVIDNSMLDLAIRHPI